ncbi:Patatin [Acidovorax sp. JS42]|uniref:patatin-like phospholipase family protein n=1 Tax=unclassified Diaphorobacter TaxID=2649760 RepID=UPI0000DCD329|nr:MULTISPECIES: patatin-like phospholipase family protein [unclassified Diaphorobacter]ABM41023.1 Patatin [Acidovorax sp. JS42]POR11037.1 patatin [Diaphorobacter sp. LR2014-1]QYY26365.1 patatin-like phospholipase family protein [Diaphorobacter sp. MNS-0]
MPEQGAPQRLNLALQGGGSHGALTWGVLDALLEDGQFLIDGVSGTSAGAMNAVALAHGFAQAAREHKDPLEAHRAGCELARATLARLWEGVGTLGSLTWGIPLPGAGPLLGMMSHWLSPYQTNPLDINPLRRVLEREVDFEALASARVPQSTTVPQVFVCATNVRTGRGEIFTGKRLSADAVMASACLPLLFKAVEIDGEHYWDGGYSGNPALHPLIYKTDCADVLLVQINPIEHQGVPDSASEIMERMNEVTFNAALLSELRAIEFVRRLLAEGKLDARRYKSVRMHRIDGGAVLEPFGAASKLRADLAFVRRLFDLGRAAGQDWLQAHRADVGVRTTVNIADNA